MSESVLPMFSSKSFRVSGLAFRSSIHCWAYTLRKPEGKETRVPSMFIAALFIIARTWKQPRCPSADEWIRKLWYIYTMEYYSAIKRNTFESVLMRWMNLESIIKSEVSPKEKDKYCILLEKTLESLLDCKEIQPVHPKGNQP